MGGEGGKREEEGEVKKEQRRGEKEKAGLTVSCCTDAWHTEQLGEHTCRKHSSLKYTLTRYISCTISICYNSTHRADAACTGWLCTNIFPHGRI